MRYTVTGLAIWAAVTVAFRFAGQYVLSPGQSFRLALAFCLTPLLMVLLMRTVFRLNHVLGADRPRVAILLLLPGLLLDAASTYWFPVVFPNMAPATGMPFAALLLFAYGSGFASALGP